MSEPFRETIDADGVCTITLDRPERLNALTFGIYRALADRFAALRSEPRVHAVVIAGAGRAFCSGGDVRDIIGNLIDMPPAEVLAFTRLTGELIVNMRRLEKPVVAAVHGMAAGAGAVIALASDLRVFGSEGKIAFLFTRVGLTGADMGAGYLLPRLVGHARAAELLLLGDTLDAAAAERAGLALVHCKFFNLAAAPGWWLNGRVLKRGEPPEGQIRLYDRLVPAFRLIDRFTGPPFGASLIAAAEPLSAGRNAADAG